MRAAVVVLAAAAIGVGGWIGYRATQPPACHVVPAKHGTYFDRPAHTVCR